MTPGEVSGWAGHCLSLEVVDLVNGEAGWLASEMDNFDSREIFDLHAWPWDVTRTIAEQDIARIIEQRANLQAGRGDALGNVYADDHATPIAFAKPPTGEVVNTFADWSEEDEVTTACEECETTDGCEPHQKFTCGACGKLTDWKGGGTDDESGKGGDECSDCWLKRTTAEENEVERTFTFSTGYMGDAAAWCFWETDTPREGACGPFASREEAVAYALCMIEDMPEDVLSDAAPVDSVTITIDGDKAAAPTGFVELFDALSDLQPWRCPVSSNECTIRRRCTNRCGRAAHGPAALSALQAADAMAEQAMRERMIAENKRGLQTDSVTITLEEPQAWDEILNGPPLGAPGGGGE